MSLQSESITICQLNNPFDPRDRTIKVVPYDPAMDLANYVDMTGDGVNWEFYSNGKAYDSLALIPVEPGSHIALAPRLEGDNTGQILGLVAMIAMAFVAPQLVGVMSGVGWGAVGTTHVLTTLGTLAAGAISMATSMILNAILPAAAPDTPKIGSDSWNESQTYSWGPLQQSVGQGSVIPIIFGEVRVGGHEISKFIRTASTKQYLNILLGVADVPINTELEAVAGTQHNTVSLSDCRINGQPATSFDEVSVDYRSGTPNDALITGFDKVVEQTDWNQKLDYNDSVTILSNGDALDQMELEFTAPYGMFYMNKKGSPETRWATIKVEYKKESEGSYVLHSNVDVRGATLQPVRKTVLIDGLVYGEKYHVRLTRTNAETLSSTKEKSAVFLVAVREIIERRLIYPGLAKYGVKALATDQLSGGIPTFDVLANRSQVDVYNPYTSSWVVKSANNPAWAYYALLNTHHGIPSNRILYDEIKAWADYCDEDVDGSPRFRINLTLDQSDSLWGNAQKICLVGRAQPIRRGSRYGVHADMPSTPVHLFTMGNIEQGSFTLDFVSLEDRANGIEITYIDKDRDHTRQVVSILTSAYNDEDSPDNITSVRLFGATDRDQVIRDGVHRLNGNINLYRLISFGANIDSLPLQVGDLFYFLHDAPGWGISGRVVSATTTEITLDQPVLMLANTPYSVLVHLTDGTILVRSLQNVSVDTTSATLTFASALPGGSVPQLYDVYGFGQSSSVQRIYRCVGFGRTQKLTKTIFGVEYRSEIYTDNMQVIDLPETRDKVQRVTGVYADEQIVYANDGTYSSILSVSWHLAADNLTQAWEVWLVDLTEGSSKIGPLTTVTDNLVISAGNLVVGHQYRVYVTPPGRGAVAIGNNYATVTINGKDDPPPKVSSFTVSALADGTRRFEFSLAEPPSDHVGFVIRYRQGTGWTWDDMMDLTRDGLPLKTSPLETNQLQAGTYTFSIKALDRSGLLSLQELQIVTTLGAPRMGNVIYEAYPTGVWSGTLTNCYRSNDGTLQGKSTKTWADFTTDGVTWDTWDAWNRAPVPSCTYEEPVINLGAVLSFSPIITVDGHGNVSVEPQISYSTNGTDYTAWAVPTTELISAQYLKVRAVSTCDDGSVPTITGLQIQLSAVSITEDLNDLSTSGLSATYRVAAGNFYLPLTKNFTTITQVQITLQNVGAGWTWEISGSAPSDGKFKQVSGKLAPHIKVYNASGVLSDALIDAYVKGV